MMSTEATRISWAIGTAITTCIFGLKIFTRIKYVGGLKKDDYLASIAWVFLLVGSAFTFAMLDLGLQRSRWSYILLPPQDLSKLLKYFYISDQLYIFGILFNKLSLIFLYKRITRSAATLKMLNHVLTGLALFCFLFSMGLFISDLFWCRPLKAFWTWMPIPQSPQYCSTKYLNTTVYVWQGFNVASDLAIMFIPYFLLSAASLPHRSQRYALYFLFSLSVFVIISSLVKIVGIARNFEVYSLVLWSIIEGNVAMCVACLPSLPPLIWRTARMTGSSAGNSRSQRSGDRSNGKGTNGSAEMSGSSHSRARSFRNSYGLRRDMHMGLSGVVVRGRHEMSIVEIEAARLDEQCQQDMKFGRLAKEDDIEMGDRSSFGNSDDTLASEESADSIRHMENIHRSDHELTLKLTLSR